MKGFSLKDGFKAVETKSIDRSGFLGIIDKVKIEVKEEEEEFFLGKLNEVASWLHVLSDLEPHTPGSEEDLLETIIYSPAAEREEEQCYRGEIFANAPKIEYEHFVINKLVSR